jgi:hypothetical protein
MDQPKLTRGSSITSTKPFKNFQKSQSRLGELMFDPIEELVLSYRKLEAEIRYQELIRDGQIVELRTDGKPRAYNPDRHLELYDKLTNIADKLLRYGYGRVPEIQAAAAPPKQALIVNLTRPGQKYIINAEDEADIELIEGKIE